MSWQMTQRAAQLKVGSPAAKAVLLVLAEAADKHGRCFLAQRTVAERAECSLDTVQRALKGFAQNALVRRASRYAKGGRRTSDVMTLTLPAVADGEPRPQGAAKARYRLGRKVRSPRPHGAGDHFIEPVSEQVERALSEPKVLKETLPHSWSLPPEWRQWTQAHFNASNDAVAKSAARFHAKKSDAPRTPEQWLREWKAWCHDERKFAPKQQTPSAQPSFEVYRNAVKIFQAGGGWDDRQLGAPPGLPECRVPGEILAEFPGVGRAA